MQDIVSLGVRVAFQYNRSEVEAKEGGCAAVDDEGGEDSADEVEDEVEAEAEDTLDDGDDRRDDEECVKA